MHTPDIAAREIKVCLEEGLGNRIRPTLSALFIGYKLNLPVRLQWSITESCLCPVEMLFQPRLTWTEFNGPYLDYRLDHPQSLIAFENFLHKDSSFILRSGRYFESFHRRHPDEAGRWIISNFDYYFTPLEPLKNKISKFTTEHMLDHAIGVHVRRGDRLIRRPGNLPHIDTYFRIIDHTMTDNSRIFLATDDGKCVNDSDVIRKFSERYGKNLICYPKTSTGRDIQDIQDALVELWLLRNCERLIGCKCSTYSETAAIGRSAILI